MRRLVTRPSVSRAGTSNSDLAAQKQPQRGCNFPALLGCPEQGQGHAGAWPASSSALTAKLRELAGAERRAI